MLYAAIVVICIIGIFSFAYFITDNIYPPSLTKNGREHGFPLGGLSTSILSTARRASHAGILFPARGHTHKPFTGWGKAKAYLDELSGVSGWTLHDIRRTVATRMAEMGVAPHVIERLLNHVTGTLSPIALVYNKARYLDEMREAIDLWDAHITALTA
jgi:integrase